MSSKYYVGPIFNNKFRMSGWFGDSYRHSLASLGVKTGRKMSNRPPKVLSIFRREAVNPNPPKVLPKYVKETPFKFAEKDMPVHEALGLVTEPQKIQAIRELESKPMPKPKVKKFRGLGYGLRVPFAYVGETGKRVWSGAPTEGVFKHPKATEAKVLQWQQRASEERALGRQKEQERKKEEQEERRQIQDLLKTERAQRAERLKADVAKERHELAKIKEGIRLW